MPCLAASPTSASNVSLDFFDAIRFAMLDQGRRPFGLGRLAGVGRALQHRSGQGGVQYVPIIHDHSCPKFYKRAHRSIGPGASPSRRAPKRGADRRDPQLVRGIAVRLIEEYAAMLNKRGLPITPGSLYLAYFAAPAGAVSYCPAQTMPMLLPLWPPLTRRDEPHAKNWSMLIHSSRC